MKRFLASLFAVLAFVMPLLAQFTSDGYYRVQNFGTKRYLYVKDNTGSYDMHRDVGDFAAIQLWKTESMTVSDPSCLMYIKKMGTDLYDLTAQGTGIYAMVQRYVDVHQVTAGASRSTFPIMNFHRSIEARWVRVATRPIATGTSMLSLRLATPTLASLRTYRRAASTTTPSMPLSLSVSTPPE